MHPCSSAAVAIVLLGCADMDVQMQRLQVALRLHGTNDNIALWITGTPDEVLQMGNAAPGTVCLEMQSENTADNAVQMKHVLPPSTSEVWVVTSEFHMPRTQLIFEHVWKSTGWKRLYVTVPDVHDRTKMRMERLHQTHWRQDVTAAQVKRAVAAHGFFYSSL